MSLFKTLFFRRYSNLRSLLYDIHRFDQLSDDDFSKYLRWFPHLFYDSGFLGLNSQPAFPKAYKNITSDIFKKTYSALLLYYAFRKGINNSTFASLDEFVNKLLGRYSTLDVLAVKSLSLKWKDLNRDELDHELYQLFRDSGVFNNVFSADDIEVEKWFVNFSHQTFEFVMKGF